MGRIIQKLNIVSYNFSWNEGIIEQSHYSLIYSIQKSNFQVNVIFIKIYRQTFNNLLYKLSLTLLRFCLAKLTDKLAD